MILIKKFTEIMSNSEVDNLGKTELFILTVLANHKQRYGIEIQKEIKAIIGRDLSLGAIYGALTRLEKKQYVAISLIGGETKKRGGRKKIYFKITEQGQKVLHENVLDFERVRGVLFASNENAI